MGIWDVDLPTKTKKKAPAPSRHERAEHAGRVPQPGVPEGPRQTVAPAPSSPAYSKQTIRRTKERKQRRYLNRRLKTVERTRKAKALLSKPKTKAKVTPRITPSTKPVKVMGVKTAGAPTLKELTKAADTGTLQTNQRGYLTTPPVRKVSKELKQAKAKAPRLTGLTPPEKKFANQVAKETPLKPRTVAAWTKLEGGNSTGDFNRLNVGHTDSGPLSLTGDPRWRNPKKAGHLTAEFLKGRYGGASEGIQAVLPASKGKPPAKQLDVIAGSGWATDPAYREKLQSTLSSVGAEGKPIPKKLLKKAKKLGLTSEPAKKKKARRTPTIVRLGRTAQKKFGLHVSENPAFDTVDPVHTAGSYHYSGEAIDVSGDAEAMAQFDRYVASRFGDTVAELFYDPGVSIDNGVPIGPIGGHSDHVHVAIDEPGTKAYGLTAVANGLPASGSAPLAYYGAGATPAAAKASAQRAKKAARQGKALTPSQKAQRKMRKLESLGIGTPTSTSESKVASPTLKSLEQKYGVKAA